MTSPASASPHAASGVHYDVVIVGGGVVGSATAWHLLEQAPGMSVLVVEPDSAYTGAASSQASGGVRQLFSRPENVQMSRYTHQIIDEWATWTAPGRELDERTNPDLSWTPNGYLFITDHELSDQLHRDFEQQKSLGVEAVWLEPDQLAERYPLIATADLGPAILSPRDGWLAPSALLDGMVRRSKLLGAEYLRDRVSVVTRDTHRATGVVLESGATVTADHVINVAGVWGTELSADLGLKLPVEPMRRFDHYVETPLDVSHYPFIKDPAGLAVRPEGAGMTAALVDFSTPAGWDLSIDPSWFEEVVWPALVERVPDADRLKLVSTWSGHYDQNRLDGQMILDRWTGELDNYYVATGFSGHGLMHAPAVGRALSELVLHGTFQSLDLTRMGLQRVLDDEPYRELTIR